MLITALTKQTKTKTRVEIDYDKTLVLSDKDIGLYGLKENEEIPESTYAAILKQLRSAALIKCGSLLGDMDCSASALKSKLIRAGFPDETAEEAVREMENAGYVDDRRYADNYIRYHLKEHGVARIRMELLRKGVASSLIEETLAALEEDGSVRDQEREQILRLMEKRHYDPQTADRDESRKMAAYLMRRGYSSEMIRSMMRGGDPYSDF